MKNRFETLWTGCCSRAKVSITYQPVPQVFQEWEIDHIRSSWKSRTEQAAREGLSIYNSKIVRLIHFHSAIDGSVALVVGPTDYRDYVATRDPSLSIQRANPVGTCVIPITRDGFVPLGRRSASSEVNAGKYFTFGGFFDAQSDIYSGRHCIFSCVQREVREELSLRVEINKIRMISIVMDSINVHPEVGFLIELDSTCDHIKSLGWRNELSSLEFVPAERLVTFAFDRVDEFTPTLLGTVRQMNLLKFHRS